MAYCYEYYYIRRIDLDGDEMRILFVDDDRTTRVAVERMLSKKYHIVTAESGTQALEMLEEYPYEIIISDYVMPEMDGVEFLRKSVEFAPDSIRLMLTGMPSLDVAMTVINECDIFKFLVKPCGVKCLYNAISEAVDKYEMRFLRQQLLQSTMISSIDRYKDGFKVGK